MQSLIISWTPGRLEHSQISNYSSDTSNAAVFFLKHKGLTDWLHSWWLDYSWQNFTSDVNLI